MPDCHDFVDNGKRMSKRPRAQNERSYCCSCKFRLMVDKDKFYCAVFYGPDGWAYLFPTKSKWRHPHDCQYFTVGEAVFLGHQITPADFMEIAGKLILSTDWSRKLGG